ncbi:MAG TPA: Uma2 family endonuclease [Isosphaeraceae bacterium]|nr:Uma2 family endonuclease [Isosphaeraceae bacterium]
MSSTSQTTATIEDLHRVEGKAELIAGRIVHYMATGFRPGQIGGRIYQSLDFHARSTGRGVALPDIVGFVVPELSSGRQSFSPDASYFLGELPSDEMDFLQGPPTFAVEVRSKGDYGASAEAEMAAKRADYFEAGTLVVWDVDPKEEWVRSYRADSPNQPTLFHRGQVADAEPAVPGWRLSLDELFA